MTTVVCPYCRNPAELVTGREVYPHRADLVEKRFYVCAPCDARVGTHPQPRNGEWIPLGTLATAALRMQRSRVHAMIDPIWQGGRYSRSSVYSWLSRQLGVPSFHTGEATAEQCALALAALPSHAFYSSTQGRAALQPLSTLFTQYEATRVAETSETPARAEPRPQPRKGAGEKPSQADGRLLGPRKRLWSGSW